MVHVTGGVNLVWNPACADMPPNWPCMDHSPTGSYGESPGFGGPVQLFNVASGVSSAVRLRGSGGAGTTPASAVGIFYQTRPGPLVGHVSMTAVYAHNSINGGRTPSWFVSGDYTVTATRIDAPFTVTESAPEPDGTRTYTAEPLPGLRFSNFPTSGQFPPGAAFWSFHPGDSLPDQPARSGPGWQVPGCQYQLVCRYKPPVPGRMQVNAFVEWQRAIVRSRPAFVPEPRLSLTCNAHSDSVAVERGEAIDCRAEATPVGGGPITWEFAADSSAYRNPAAGGTPHRGTSWTGKMVLSGTITARASLENRALEARVHVRVAPRNWVGKAFEATAAEESAESGEFTARPNVVQRLGHIHHMVTYVITRGDNWEPIISGPNGLLGYFLKIPVSYHGRVHVNRLALSVGSDFWNAQPDRLPNLRPGDPIRCTRAEVEPFIPIILRHEGVGFDPKSHAYLWVEQGKKEFGPATEPIVGTSAQDLYNKAVAALDPAMTRADSAANLADTRGYAPVYCTFNYSYPRAAP
jgi:hypothetical protein